MKGKNHLDTLQAQLGYTFKDPGLLAGAVTHASALSENPGLTSYERLEFLGDAVLQLLSTRHLYDAYPESPEGQLSRVRAGAVSEPSLARIAQKLNLGRYLVMGKGTDRMGGRSTPSVLADMVEAILAAIYLDGGLDAARAWIMPHLLPEIQHVLDGGLDVDSKTRLQEWLQRDGPIDLSYTTVKEEGPPHQRVFTVSLRQDGKELAEGSGPSKKQAEQAAAAAALEILNGSHVE